MPDKPTILIVDDERDIIRGLAIRIRAAGFEVIQAINGAEGLEMAINTTPDAILLDINMPVMDGMEVLSALKKSPKTNAIPVLVMSANVVEKTKSRAHALGAQGFIQKPFQADKVITELKNCTTAVAEL